MAETREKTHHILLSTDGKNTALELFAAGLWPDQPSADGLFRVRINGKWYSPVEKYTFLTMAAVGELAAKLLSGSEAYAPEPAPNIKPRQSVSVHLGECEQGVPLSGHRGWTTSPPFRGIDGRWYVFVSMHDGQHTFVRAYPVDDVTVCK